MALPDLKFLPKDFKELETSVPNGWVILQNVLDPVLFIRREHGRYELLLGARIRRKNSIAVLFAPSLDHNWVFGGGLACPLPIDSPQVIRSFIGEAKNTGLTFPKVLELTRLKDTGIEVEIDASVVTSASEEAKSQSTTVDVPDLNAQLYSYQAQGVAWMRSVLSQTGGVILADEMGLGKTIQIISLLLLDRPLPSEPALILCPTTLIANWVREIQRFAPSLSIYVHRGQNRVRIPRDLVGTHVVISTYDTLVNDLVVFKAIEWGWLICDEAQALKNPDSLRHQSVTQVPRKRSIPVTGTPVENHLLDLWALSEVAIPGLLGERQIFEATFPDTDGSAKELATITGPIILRRRVRDVAGDLPERMDIRVPLELGSDLAEQYEAVRQEALRNYGAAGALVATGKLQLFCAHPELSCASNIEGMWEDQATYTGTHTPSTTPKLVRTAELLREAFANRRKVLLFSNFNACGAIIRATMGNNQCSDTYWGAINGSTAQGERQLIVDEFTEHDGPGILILNPRAAGTGLNITAATIVIHFTQVWNPALEQQASARAHRRGQKQPVTIYHMYYLDTVEEVMLDRSQARRELGSEAVPASDQEASDLRRALSLSPVAK